VNRQRHTIDEQGTLDAGVELASHLSGGTVIALEGPLGAGKTCLARGIAIGLGVDARSVASPTFAILHEHPVGIPGELRRLYHIDAYRLSGSEDLESIGWSELVEDQAGVVLVEWATRISPALPDDVWRIDVSYDSERGRLMQLCVGGNANVAAGIWDEPEESVAGGG